MEQDKVSVIIPVYNSEKFLHKTLDSILNQTYKNLQILAVNDGSTDRSLDILQEYSGKITIISQSNKGLASSLNAGIEKIQGKYLKWFSPDDILYPDAIETLVNVAKSFPDDTIVYSNWELIDKNDNKIGDFAESDYNNLSKFDFNVRLLDGQQINVNTSLIPMSLLHKGCIITELKDPVAIDYHLFLQAAILYNARFHLIPRSLVRYRIHEGQLSHKNITKTLSYLPEVRELVLSKISPDTKRLYLEGLEAFNNRKSISKKAMGFGLSLSRQMFPDFVTNRVLVFYLNKIRRSR